MTELTNTLSAKRQKLLELRLKEKRASLETQTIPRRTGLDPAPLSFTQHRLWFLDQLEPGGIHYSIPLGLRLKGHLDRAVLQKCLNHVVQRHEALRTCFEVVGGQPRQVIKPVVPVEIALVDAGNFPEAQQEAEALRLCAEEVQRPFDLAHGPVIRAKLIRLGAREHIFLLVMHHIASDGWSVGVLIREVESLYKAFCEGQPSPLTELPVQYADFAAWQQQWLRGEVLEEQLGYWRKQLQGAPALLELPTDRPRPATQSYRGAVLPLELPKPLLAGLRELSRREGATLFMTLLASFQTLLHRYTNSDDILVGSPMAGRNRTELEPLIGVFVNTHILRGDLSGNPSFRTLLGRTRETALGAYAHEHLPFEKLVEELRPERNMSHSPLFQVMFVLQNALWETAQLTGLEVTQLRIDNGTSKFDLTLYLGECEDALHAAMEYNTDLFEAETIRRMLGHYQTLLEGIVANPDQRLSDLPLLTEAERHQLLVEWNPERAEPCLAGCVHELFEKQVERSPDAVAVVLENEKLTYRELNQRANQLAHALRRMGVGPETLVGVYMERSLEMVIGILGIVKAGGAYLPLDPVYPPERLAFMLEDARPKAVVTQQRLRDSLPKNGVAILSLDADRERLCRESAANPAGGARLDDLAYVIYTSGSTGKPKGTLVTHRNVARLFQATQAWFHFGVQDVWTLFHSHAFDFSVWELWGALAHGGRLVVVPYLVSRSPDAFYELLSSQRVTVLNQTPSAFRQLIQAEEAGRQPLPLALRYVIFGGEALEMQSLKPWFDRHGDQCPRLVNMYGITETTVHVTYRPLSSADLNSGSVIGIPIPDLQVYILDRNRQFAPVGVPGELYVGGAGVARGYLNRPELSAEKFIENPFTTKQGDRLYRSGDLARYLPNRDLEYLGRIDNQVKYRGFRIELGEIESVLAGLPGVREAVVLAREDVPGDKRLAAYLTAKEEGALKISELRGLLQAKLPDYMVPSAFLTLDRLPLTPNGKVDRKALPRPELQSEPAGFVPPASTTEKALANIWTELLGIKQVGLHDNFFELGGHSLLATRAVSRARAEFQVDLPLRTLFEHPTLSRHAAQIDVLLGAAIPEFSQKAKASAQEQPLIRAVSRNGKLPLSFAQQRLWFLGQMEPESALYNVPMGLRLAGVVDVPVLQRCLSEILRRHESLRTCFEAVEGQPAQVIQPAASLDLPLVDLRALPEPEREGEVRRKSMEEAQRPFDLRRDIMLRATLFRLGERDHVLFLNVHHIASDGWSLGLLVGELKALYEAFVAGKPSPLPELAIQYADFAVWQRESLQGEVLEKQLGYWKKQLEGAPALLDLPTDRPRPAQQSYRGALMERELPKPLSAALGELSWREGATLFMTLLAGFQTLLHRYTGSEDILAGSVIAGRNRTEIEPLIGFFVNTLVLRGDLSGNPSYRTLLGRTREAALGAFTHQDLPFERLVEELHVGRDMSHSPLFQVMFVLQNAPWEAAQLAGLEVASMPLDSEVSKFDLTLFVTERAGALQAVVEYNTDLFEAETIRRMLGHYQTLLEGIVANPDQRLSDLPLLTETERQQLVVEWNRTEVAYPKDRCLHQLVAEQAKRTPEAVAVVFENQQLTYRQLNERANQLAHYLQGLGVGPDTLVGICVERSLEMVVGLLGILKAGGAYLPLDPSYPRERLAFMLEDTQAPVLLAHSNLLDRLPATNARVIRLAAGVTTWARESVENPDSAVRPENLAYVTYTSGSTGKPKGVQVLHRGVTRLVLGAEYARFDASRVFLQLAPISFDASTLEIWGPLLQGATCVIAPPGAQSPEQIGQLLRKHQVTTLWLTSTLYNTVIDLAPSALSSVSELLIGGESLSPSHVQQGLRMLPQTQIINGYGPTESTTFTCCYRIPKQFNPGALSIPIGRPISNTQVYILDDRKNPVPIGVAGELHIGGDGLARGYVKRPDLTAEKFVHNPFSAQPGARLYRTGDLARYLPDGNIEFLGRTDHQVKIRGFRIELGEIESVLAGHPLVREAVVLAREDIPGDKRLVAYVTGKKGETPKVSELRSLLQAKLPEYMVPSAFLVLEMLPLNPNGKLDRKALPQPDFQSEPAAFVPPASTTEKALANIWSELLGIKQVGLHDNFFELGGHSLLATRAVSRASTTFKVDLPLRALFEHPTLASHAGQIDTFLWAREQKHETAPGSADVLVEGNI